MPRIPPVAFAVAAVCAVAACSSNPPPRYGYSSGTPYGYSSVPSSAVTVYPQAYSAPQGGNPYGPSSAPASTNGTPFGADPRDTPQGKRQHRRSDMQRLLTLSAVAAGLLALAACSSFGSDQQVSYSNGSSYGTVQLPYTMRAPAANAEAYAGPNWPGQNPYSTSPSDNMPAPYNLTHGIVRP